MKSIVILNGLISLTSVALLGIYGRLHWWYRGLVKAGVDPSVRKGFFEALDWLPIGTIVLSLLALAISITMKRLGLPKNWAIPAILFSAITALFCLFVRI